MTLPVQLTCSFCGNPLRIENSTVQVCACPESERAAVAAKEKARLHHRQNALTFKELRERNKMSNRRRGVK